MIFLKVHEATEGVSVTPDRNHLTVLEVYMLRHPDLLRKVRHQFQMASLAQLGEHLLQS